VRPWNRIIVAIVIAALAVAAVLLFVGVVTLD